MTPVEREFGFTNKLDRIAPYAQVVADWNAIPIPAKNQLTITASSSVAGATHGWTVADADTPSGPNGLPLYLPEWDRACFSF
ncbi:MAG: hypothetical protein IAI50_09105 [Candidatus Eremiobacteraeota bacterium]|nr:hypothetical protein [Candidatus Eremiobacteraeota bacterium]